MIKMSSAGHHVRLLLVVLLAAALAACANVRPGNRGEPAPTTSPAPTATPSAGETETTATNDTAGAQEGVTAGTEAASAEPAETDSVTNAEPEGPVDPDAPIGGYSPIVAACGPPGTLAGTSTGGGGSATSGSLFAAAQSGSATEGGRIAVERGGRGQFLRFGNVAAPIRRDRARAARRTSLNAKPLTGEWRLADGTPDCSCRITLSAGARDGPSPASAAGCTAPGLDRIANWRLRGSEIVLLGRDRTLIGSFRSRDEGRQFDGALTSGVRAILWR